MKRWSEIKNANLSPERIAQLDAAVRADLAAMDAVDALPFARASVAKAVLGARLEAGLSPERLAARVGKSASFIRETEAGRAKVDWRYVDALLRACGLPPDWKGSD